MAPGKSSPAGFKELAKNKNRTVKRTAGRQSGSLTTKQVGLPAKPLPFTRPEQPTAQAKKNGQPSDVLPTSDRAFESSGGAKDLLKAKLRKRSGSSTSVLAHPAPSQATAPRPKSRRTGEAAEDSSEKPPASRRPPQPKPRLAGRAGEESSTGSAGARGSSAGSSSSRASGGGTESGEAGGGGEEGQMRGVSQGPPPERERPLSGPMPSSSGSSGPTAPAPAHQEVSAAALQPLGLCDTARPQETAEQFRTRQAAKYVEALRRSEAERFKREMREGLAAIFDALSAQLREILHQQHQRRIKQIVADSNAFLKRMAAASPHKEEATAAAIQPLGINDTAPPLETAAQLRARQSAKHVELLLQREAERYERSTREGLAALSASIFNNLSA